jgi:hypothetical protein
MTQLSRLRLDIPEVHELLATLNTMLDDWAETTEGSTERQHLWRRVHHAAEQLTERAYGGPTWPTRTSYWLRPYDAHLDARTWRWRRPRPCQVIDPTHTTP